MFFLLHTKSKGAFSAEMFFLRYVNETAFVGICLSSKWFHLKTNFFSFLKPWANNSSTNQYSYQLLYGWGMTHFLSSLSQKCLLWERGLVKLRQPWGVSLIWLTAFGQTESSLLKLAAGHSPSPFWCLCLKLSVSFVNFNKTPLYKSSWVIKPGPWSRS